MSDELPDTVLTKPLFTLADAERAHDEWGANCGPAAIAAVLDLTLEEIRPWLGDFENKRYTNPTLMWSILDSLSVSWRRLSAPLNWPRHGLVRIQWHGPWTAPGVSPRAAYRHTHWVGAARRGDEIGVFDVNALNNGSGWCSIADWSAHIVPFILSECVPRADGRWSMTHVVEVQRRDAKQFPETVSQGDGK
jgi:hypothetical protein